MMSLEMTVLCLSTTPLIAGALQISDDFDTTIDPVFMIASLHYQLTDGGYQHACVQFCGK